MFTSPVWAELSPADSLQLKNMLQQADSYAENNKLDSAGYWYQQAVALSKKSGNQLEMINAQRGYIRLLDRQGKFNEGYLLSLEVLEASKSLGAKELSTSYNYLGNLCYHLGKLQEAAINYLKALQLAEGIGDVKNQMKYSFNLADVFADLEDLEKHYQYANNGYQLALQHQDSANIGYGLIGLAYTEMQKKEYPRAAQHFNEVLAIGQAIENPFHQMIAFANLGEIAYYQQDYQQALNFYMQGLHVLHYYPRIKTELQIYFGMAQTYARLDLFQAADHYLQKAMSLGKSAGAANQLRHVYKGGSEIYEKMQKPQLALDLWKKYQQLKDSVLSEKNRNNIHHLEIVYQTSQKEKEIALQNLILTQNQLEIERKDTLIYVSLAFVLLLFSAMILLYLIYRGRQLTNLERIKELERENRRKILMANMQGEEKERARLARDLHDGVGGILSATKMHLSVLLAQAEVLSTTKELTQTSMLLDRACKEVRTIAHHLSPEHLQKYTLEEALANYCRSVSHENLQVEFYCLGEALLLKDHHKPIYYRIIQELITTIIKHAAATHVLLQLSHYQGFISITVEDNGSRLWTEGAFGLTLLPIRQRVEELNGKLSVEAEADRGTTVYLEFEINTFVDGKPLLPVTA